MTVIRVAVPEAWPSAADTVETPPFSETEEGESESVSVGRDSSSVVLTGTSWCASRLYDRSVLLGAPSRIE